jgi:hypothetical protein
MTRDKLLNLLLYKKRALKMLMKLTPGLKPPQNLRLNFLTKI